MATVTVVGAGMMGSALSVPLADAGHEVRLVGTPLDADIIAALRRDGIHPKLRLPLPAGISFHPVEELAAAMAGVELIGLGVSSAGIDWAASALSPHVRPHVPLVMVTKGLSWGGAELEILPDVLLRGWSARGADGPKPVAIAGPCIAGELARRVPTSVVLSGRDAQAARSVARLARTSYYYPSTSPDIVGVELCAALKNAYAMGIAFGTGLHERAGGQPGSVAMHNYEAAVFAQATVEMQRLVARLGGDPSTAAGLAGVGDLNVTCNGGRTGRFGRLLGLGYSVPEAISRMEGATLECLEVLAVLRTAFTEDATGRLRADDFPLLRHLGAVAFDGHPVDVPFESFYEA